MATAAYGVNHCYCSPEVILIQRISGSTRVRSIGVLDTNELADCFVVTFLAFPQSFPGAPSYFSHLQLTLPGMIWETSVRKWESNIGDDRSYFGGFASLDLWYSMYTEKPRSNYEV